MYNIYIQITLHTNQRAMPYIFNQRLCGKEIIHRQDICIYIYYYGLTPNIFIIKSLLILEIRKEH